MSYKPRNNKKLMIWLCVGFVLVMVAATVAALLLGPSIGSGRPDSSQSEGMESSDLPSEDENGEEEDVIDADATGSVIDNAPVTYNKPGEMRAVYLTPGEDFLTATPSTPDKVKSEIDAAIANAVKLTMNTVIIDTTAKNGVLYKNDVLPVISESLDVMDYIVSKARANNLYIYAIYDALLEESGGALKAPMAVTGGALDNSVSALKSLAEYKIDGILLRGYYNETQSSSYAAYLKAGGSIGFEHYMSQVPDRLVKLLSDTMRTDARGVQFGLITDPVWLNSAQNEAGSATNASFTALGDGNADVKRYVEDKLVDFVAVEAYGSLADQAVGFNTVTKWWSDLCSRKAMDLYVVQYSSRMGNSDYTGWAGSDELAKQVTELKDLAGYSGSIFNSLSKLAANPGGATDTLLKVFKDEINPDFLFTELTVSKPEKNTFTTEEKTVTFTGGSDPTRPVTINGKEIAADETGFFSQMYDLKAGANTFTITHKDKTMTYTVTRTVQVLKEMSPTGNLTVDSGMEITVTAMAYEGAKVTASLGGSTISLSQSTQDDDDTDRESSYVKYTGSFTASGAGQSLGQIKVTASYEGTSATLAGASVRVNKRVEIGDGEPVRVTATQAETFSTSRLDDISDPSYYPLPKGVLDYTVGDQIIYKDGSNTYSYYNLASGMRVYSNDVTSTSEETGGNAIKGIKVDSDSRYTTVTLYMNQLASYSLRQSSSAVSIEFHNTKSVPDNLSLNKNPLFSSANWSGTTLKLSLKGGFLGYKAYTESGAIVFRFNNPPSMGSGGLGGAYIVVDAGHGGSDPGAISFPGMTEANINAAIAKKLVNALEDMGASVKMVGGSTTSLSQRVSAAESYNANLFISVHNNSATASAKGTEAFYFRSWASGLAKGASNGAASALNTTNRGGKYGLYYVTRVSQFPAILTECGFITNESEYKKLCTSSYQNKIANYIASAVEDYFDDNGGGRTATGTQSAGSTGTTVVTGVSLNKTTLSLGVGASEKLAATVAPSGASQSVSWKSSDTRVATVGTDGTVKGIKEGSATITVTTDDGGKTATCKVTVTRADIAVSLSPTTAELLAGDSTTLTATVTVGGTAQSGEKVTWKSSDESIAKVDSSGKVTGVKAGTVTITATSVTDTGKTATCRVTVVNKTVAVTGVTLNKTSLTLTEGSSETLTATVAPNNVTNKKVTWSSSNTTVATVDNNGKVTAKGAGSATITVKTEDGNKTATCEVTVTAANVPVEKVTLDKDSLSLEVNATDSLTATIAPENASNKNVTWSSSKPDVATVDDNGNITAKAAGEAIITVTTKDGGKTATCKVTVTAAESSVSPPESSATEPSATEPSDETGASSPTSATENQNTSASS